MMCYNIYKIKVCYDTNSVFANVYWYVAYAESSLHAPVDHLTIYYKLEQFWFNYIASCMAIIHHLLNKQQPVFFLQSFLLTHTFFQPKIGELHLVTNSALPSSENCVVHNLVHISSTTWHFNWTTNSTILFHPMWQVTPNYHNQHFVNPSQPYFLPPSSPATSKLDFNSWMTSSIIYPLTLTMKKMIWTKKNTS